MQKLKFKGRYPRWKHPAEVVQLKTQMLNEGYKVNQLDIVQAWEAYSDDLTKAWAMLREPEKNVEILKRYLHEVL